MLEKVRIAFFTLAALMVTVSNGRAAEMGKVPAGAVDFIFIEGDIEPGDSNRFSSLVSGDRHAIVYLNSPGGAVHDGLNIGLQVKRHGFATAVADNKMCASICSMIWLAGSTRYFETKSRIGFHAAYSLTDGQANVSSTANAEIGYYIGVIGLAPHVARIATEAAPDSMKWMGQEDLLYAGIAVMSVQAIGDSKNLKPRPWATSPRVMDNGSYTPIDAITMMTAKLADTKFREVYSESGISGVRQESTSCWADVRSDGDSTLIRYCLLFDMLSMAVDAYVASQMGLPRMEYFQATQISTRLIAFMKKHGYVPQQIDELLVSASLHRPA